MRKGLRRSAIRSRKLPTPISPDVFIDRAREALKEGKVVSLSPEVDAIVTKLSANIGKLARTTIIEMLKDAEKNSDKSMFDALMITQATWETEYFEMPDDNENKSRFFQVVSEQLVSITDSMMGL